MQRVFALNSANGFLVMDEEDVFHFRNVLRMDAGERFEAVLGDKLYLAEVVSRIPFTAKILGELPPSGELVSPLTLCFALAKGDKNDLVVQKATELGVSDITFFDSARSIVHPKDFESRKERLIKIAKGASMQSRRMKVPAINGIVPLEDLPDISSGVKGFYCYETLLGGTIDAYDAFSLLKPNEQIYVLVGPEGGISEEEAALLSSKGYMPISLGGRILRTETAAISVLSVLAFFLDRL